MRKFAVLVLCTSAQNESRSKSGKSGKRVAAAEAKAVVAKRGLFTYCIVSTG